MNVSWTGSSPSRTPTLFSVHPAVLLTWYLSERSRESPSSFCVAVGSSLLGHMLQEEPTRGLRPDMVLLGDPGGWGWSDDGHPTCGYLPAQLGLSYFAVTRDLVKCLNLFLSEGPVRWGVIVIED